MSMNRNLKISVVSLLGAGLLAASASHAATQPATVTKFTAKVTDAVFTPRSKSWRDPAFGDMGWTHSSSWGIVHAQKGQTVTITMAATDAGIHPGATVWYRGADDTAPDSYVVDHFYPQNANFTEFGAKDESTGADLGNIVMRNVIYGYDFDGNTKRVRTMNPITDNVPGQLVLKFTAPRRGNYMFVVGGFNPDAGVDTSLSYNVNVNVVVTGP